MSGVSLKVQVLCPKVGFLWLGPHTDTRMCIYIYIGGKEMLGSLSKVRPSQVLSRSEMLEFGFALKGEALQRCDIYIYIYIYRMCFVGPSERFLSQGVKGWGYIGFVSKVWLGFGFLSKVRLSKGQFRFLLCGISQVL